MPGGGLFQRRWDELAPAVRGIPVGRKCQRIHVLHGARSPEAEGAAIGSYLCHYADGSTQAVDIVYGADVRSFYPWALDPKREIQRGKLAWAGANPVSIQAQGEVRLYLRSYENPRPEAEVASLDFLSRLTASAPFLVAITVE